MLSSDPAMRATFPQGYALLPGTPPEPRFGVPGHAPTAQQPNAAETPNRRSSPDSDQQLRSLIADAMRQLPFEYRTAIYLAHHQRWTVERIADALKITEAAVKSRLHDGLRTLRLNISPNEAAAVNPGQIDHQSHLF
jgi:DNA-directed RNA polymerase specialized sigma24 family protein